MFADSPDAEKYLRELLGRTSGDTAQLVSMYEVGAAIGLDKAAAGKVAEDLIGNGLVEVKTLSGGIGITDQGVAAVQEAGTSAGATSDIRLGNGPVLDEKDRNGLEVLLADIKTGISKNAPAYANLEEMVIDIKTAEVQMLSPKPKTAILLEVLRSLQKSLAGAGSSELPARLKLIVDA